MRKTISITILAFTLSFGFIIPSTSAAAITPQESVINPAEVSPQARYREVYEVVFYDKKADIKSSIQYNKHNYTGTLYLFTDYYNSYTKKWEGVYRGTVSCEGVCPVSMQEE